MHVRLMPTTSWPPENQNDHGLGRPQAACCDVTSLHMDRWMDSCDLHVGHTHTYSFVDCTTRKNHENSRWGSK